jgi:hypothetical protein
MAHKKVHPADRKAPPQNQDGSPKEAAMQTQPANADYQHDPKRRMGAFVGKGEHARQQQMGNKD